MKHHDKLHFCRRSVNNPKECRRLTIADARFFVDEAKASTLGAVITKDFWKANAVNGRRRVTRSSKRLLYYIIYE